MKSIITINLLGVLSFVTNLSAQNVASFSDVCQLYEDRKYEDLIKQGQLFLSHSLGERKREAVLFFLADGYFQKQNYPLAIETSGILLESYPDSPLVPRIHVIMGRSYYLLGYDINTVGHMKYVLKHHDQSFWGLESAKVLGDALYRLKNYLGAVGAYELFLTKIKGESQSIQEKWDFQMYQALYYSGLGYFHMDQYDACLDRMNQALRLPLNQDQKQAVLYGKVKALMGMLRFRETLLITEKMTKGVDKTSIWYRRALYEKVQIYMKLQDYSQARQALAVYQDIFELSAEERKDIDHQKALSFFYEKQYAESIAIWEVMDYSQKDSLTAEAYVFFGLSYYNLANYKMAIQLFKTVADLFPRKSSRVYYYQAWSYIRLGKIKEGIQVFDQMIKLYPQDPLIADVLLWIADYYALKGDYDKKKGSLGQIIEHYPESDLVGDAHYQLAHIYLNEGLRNKALEYLDFIEPHNEVFREALLSKMDIYIQQGRYLRVIDTLEPLIFDEDVLILKQNMAYLLGQAYGGMKDWMRAEEYFKQSMYGHEGPIIISSMLALADVLFHQSLWTEALNIYINVQTRMSRFKTEDMYFKTKLGVARCFEKLVQYDAAQTVYNEIVSMKNPKYTAIAKEMKGVLRQKRKGRDL